MQKINFLPIILDHIMTLKDARTKKLSITDILFFYLSPFLCGIYFAYSDILISQGALNIFVSIFSVFSALLFSAQISLYGLKSEAPLRKGDPVSDELALEKFNRHKNYLENVNCNVSYLILTSCIILIFMALFLVTNVDESFKKFFIFSTIPHFFLTLLMIIKRTHIAFKIGHER